MSDCYNVVFNGGVAEGHEKNEVKKRLASILKEDSATIDKIFSGKPLIIKRDADLATCEKIQKVFLSAGAICSIKKSENQTASQPDTKAESSSQTIENDSASQPINKKIQLSELKDNLTKKLSDIPGSTKQIISNTSKKYSSLKSEASSSIENDIETGGVKILLKNRYFLTLVASSLVLLTLIIFVFTYENNPMPLTDTNLNHLADHIDFVEQAFTTEELETRSKNKKDYLDYLLVKPINKMGYDFNDTIVDLSKEYLDDDFSKANLAKIKTYLMLLTKERDKLYELDFISGSGKKKLDKVSKKLQK